MVGVVVVRRGPVAHDIRPFVQPGDLDIIIPLGGGRQLTCADKVRRSPLPAPGAMGIDVGVDGVDSKGEWA